MNASRLVLTLGGTIGALAAGIGIGAALYASVEPAATTTTVVRAEASGSPERTAATVPGGLSVNAIYERTHAGVVDITVATSYPAGVTTDVQVKAPGAGTFSPAPGGTGVNTNTYSFNPGGVHGTYRFQVRTSSGGNSSGWSPTISIVF